jgi:apolipoprotein N-acyltransferase
VSLLLLLFGWWRSSLTPAGEQLNALVVQPNVDTTSQWTQQMQDSVKDVMSRVLRGAVGVDLMLFPETIVPDATAYPFSDLIARANARGITVLIGTFLEEEGRSYNTVAAFEPAGEAQSYRKQHLVPWGEYVPFRRWTPWVEHFGVVSADVAPGAEPLLLTRWRIGTPVCFESTLPRIACEMARHGAHLLCVVTNDTWFGRSPAAAQHLAFCALRAVETRRWVLRSATTGISAVFDAQGRCLQRAELFTEAVLKQNGVELRTERTLYTRLGDPVAVGVLLALCIAGGRLSVHREG